MTINFDPITNAERAKNGAVITDLHTELAVAAGSIPSAAERAEIGRALAEVHHGGRIEAVEAVSVASGLLADLFHCADGHISPRVLLDAAACEQRAMVSMAGNLLSLGEDGRPGRVVCAVAAVLDWAAWAGMCAEAVVTLAHGRWAEEAEEERFAHVRAARSRH
ncbi:hypothetical protein ABZX75_26340 [Streptomyces sp. NPDC003038]|uniref:hypothetical protein n=1 Tax=unclassified Streptomyces TaxID=2593676 RepID=UPI0033B41776